MSLHPSTSYTYEPFRQDRLSCPQRYNNSDIVEQVEDKLMGIMNCDGNVVRYIKRFSVRQNTFMCNLTNISVVKTIRVHLNGVLPWLGKYPSLKVVITLVMVLLMTLLRSSTWSETRATRLSHGCGCRDSLCASLGTSPPTARDTQVLTGRHTLITLHCIEMFNLRRPSSQSPSSS